jgi:uncharacterized protein (DUF2344 family)
MTRLDSGDAGESFFGGGGGSSISSASSELPQDAKNRAAVNMAVVSSAALKAAVNRRIPRRANSERVLHFSKYFIDISSKKLSLRHKSHWITVYLDGRKFVNGGQNRKGKRKKEKGRRKREKIRISNEQ